MLWPCHLDELQISQPCISSCYYADILHGSNNEVRIYVVTVKEKYSAGKTFHVFCALHGYRKTFLPVHFLLLVKQ